MHYIVGLGNPGDDYTLTRHNTGRVVTGAFLKAMKFPPLSFQKKYKALVSQGELGGEKVLVAFPETFMNKSGLSVKEFVSGIKKAHSLVVIYDDLDLPLGSIKISFNRGSGGHRGIESVIRSIKTKEFVRIRVGVSPVTPSGKIKKPKGEKEVSNFIISPFKPKERDIIDKVSKEVSRALKSIIDDGYECAMNEFNN